MNALKSGFVNFNGPVVNVVSPPASTPSMCGGEVEVLSSSPPIDSGMVGGEVEVINDAESRQTQDS
jgi:hypothetical protein